MGQPSLPTILQNMPSTAVVHELSMMADIMMEDSAWLDAHQSRLSAHISSSWTTAMLRISSRTREDHHHRPHSCTPCTTSRYFNRRTIRLASASATALGRDRHANLQSLLTTTADLQRPRSPPPYCHAWRFFMGLWATATVRQHQGPFRVHRGYRRVAHAFFRRSSMLLLQVEPEQI
jgi:hypothetical protein